MQFILMSWKHRVHKTKGVLESLWQSELQSTYSLNLSFTLPIAFYTCIRSHVASKKSNMPWKQTWTIANRARCPHIYTVHPSVIKTAPLHNDASSSALLFSPTFPAQILNKCVFSTDVCTHAKTALSHWHRPQMELFNDQKFDKLRKHHSDLGVPWRDPTFPASDASIGLSKIQSLPRNIQWKRPHVSVVRFPWI